MTFPPGVTIASRLTWLGIARETIPGAAVPPVAAVPVNQDGYEPEDTPSFVYDQGVRSSMGQIAGAVPGVLSSTLGFSAPLYPDSAGWWLDNLLGDTATVSTGTLGTAVALASPVNPGDTRLVTVAPLGAAAGSVVQIGDGDASEVVVVSAASGVSVAFAGCPCRFGHATTATAALQTAASAYQHTFAALNGGTGQPPSHTLTDTTGLTAGTGARAYPYACVTQIDLAGDPGAGWVTGKVTGVAWPSLPSAATAAYPGSSWVAPFAGWQSVVTVNSALAYAGKWALSLKRQTIAYLSAQNSQYPWQFARGPLTATGTLDYPDPDGETPLALLASGIQPPVTVSLAYGSAALAFTCSQVQVNKAKPDRTHPALGYTTAFQALDNAADGGGSGGLSPASVTLVNQVAAY